MNFPLVDYTKETKQEKIAPAPKTNSKNFSSARNTYSEYPNENIDKKPKFLLNIPESLIEDNTFKKALIESFTSSERGKDYDKDSLLEDFSWIQKDKKGPVFDYLETIGIPYCESDCYASVLGQDKIFITENNLFINSNNIDEVIEEFTKYESKNNLDNTNPKEKDVLITGQTQKFITEEELKALYETANNLYLDWVNPVYGPKVDWDTTVESNGWNYCPVTSGKYEDVDSIKKDLQNYFSENLYDDYVNAHFIMYDGKLYAREDLGQGGDAYCDSIKLEIISVSETECTFKVSEIRSYDSRITSHTYKIKVVDGMWKFVDSFEPSYAASFFDNHIVWDK